MTTEIIDHATGEILPPATQLERLTRQIQGAANLTPSHELTLSLLSAAQHALELATTPAEVKYVRDGLQTLKDIYRRRHANHLDRNLIAIQVVHADYALGEMLEGTNHQEGRPSKTVSTEYSFRHALSELGAERMHRLIVSCRKLAKETNQPDFDAWAEEHQEEDDFDISTYAFLKYALGNAFVSQNSGVSEWFTPPEYIAAARRVMGDIDLDPASCERANRIVKAKTFYSLKDDGLAHEWAGRVWMNPPYAADVVEAFCEKFAASVETGAVTQGLVLVNNATETEWFERLVSVSGALMFPRGRVRFLDTKLQPGAPLQGQTVLYAGCGADTKKFFKEFGEFGWCAHVIR